MIPFVKDSSFAGEIARAPRSVVMFGAEWCRHCQKCILDVEAVAKQFADEGATLTFLRMDIETDRRVAAEYEVRSVPTVLLFKDGKVVFQVIGVIPRPQLALTIRLALLTGGGRC